MDQNAHTCRWIGPMHRPIQEMLDQADQLARKHKDFEPSIRLGRVGVRHWRNLANLLTDTVFVGSTTTKTVPPSGHHQHNHQCTLYDPGADFRRPGVVRPEHGLRRLH